MQVVIKKWGNSLATRIPKSVVESINLREDQKVEVEALNGKIVMTPVKVTREYSMEELLSQCEPGAVELTEEDKDWLNDKPVGKEIW